MTNPKINNKKLVLSRETMIIIHIRLMTILSDIQQPGSIIQTQLWTGITSKI